MTNLKGRERCKRTFGRYIFFQHRSQSTLPPSTCIHLPSSIGFTQRTHVLVRGRFVDALRGLPVPVASARSSAASRFDGSVGLVCERIGSFGDFVALSLSFVRSLLGGLSRGIRDELAVEAVGEVGPSSRRVSMTRSRAPVDFDGVRGVYEDEAAVEEERERWGARGDWTVVDEEDEYRDSVMDGNRTLLSLAGVGAGVSVALNGVEMGCGLARSGTSKGCSSSSELA